jgi:hypothetical protein
MYLKGSGKFCEDCSTAERRKSMDEGNKKFFESVGIQGWYCKICDKKTNEKEEKEEEQKEE